MGGRAGGRVGRDAPAAGRRRQSARQRIARRGCPAPGPPASQPGPRPPPAPPGAGSPSAARCCGPPRTGPWRSASTPARAGRVAGGGCQGGRTGDSGGCCAAAGRHGGRVDAAAQPSAGGVQLRRHPARPQRLLRQLRPAHLRRHRVLLHQRLLGEVDMRGGSGGWVGGGLRVGLAGCWVGGWRTQPTGQARVEPARFPRPRPACSGSSAARAGDGPAHACAQLCPACLGALPPLARPPAPAAGRPSTARPTGRARRRWGRGCGGSPGTASCWRAGTCTARSAGGGWGGGKGRGGRVGCAQARKAAGAACGPASGPPAARLRPARARRRLAGAAGRAQAVRGAARGGPGGAQAAQAAAVQAAAVQAVPPPTHPPVPGSTGTAGRGSCAG